MVGENGYDVSDEAKQKCNFVNQTFSSRVIVSDKNRKIIGIFPHNNTSEIIPILYHFSGFQESTKWCVDKYIGALSEADERGDF